MAQAVLWVMIHSGPDDGWADNAPADPKPEPIDQADAEDLDLSIKDLPEPYKTRLIVRYYLTKERRKELRRKPPDSLELGEALRALQDKLDCPPTPNAQFRRG